MAARYTAHVDTFSTDNLPPREQWPHFVFDLPGLHFDPRLNAVTELLDVWLDKGHGERLAVLAPGIAWTYRRLQTQVNRIAGVLVHDLGMQTGNRVLLRGFNGPMMAACWLAVAKAGGVVVATMPLLRVKELAYVVNKAQVSIALCDERLSDDLRACCSDAPSLQTIVSFSSIDSDGLEARMQRQADTFAAVPTSAEDPCLIAFTSGTTGGPKGAVHFHRDVMAICRTFAEHVLGGTPADIFCGSPPLAFAYGVGQLLIFPLFFGAATLLLEKATPDLLLAAIAEYRATVCGTAPTAYRAMLPLLEHFDVSSLRACVSAGEALPRSTWDQWQATTGLKIIDGIGSTEMLHIFIASAGEAIRPGATGKPVPGYTACIVDDDGKMLEPGTVGRLAVRGPTGCRYLADARQGTYVRNGWNLTGDAYHADADGYFWYHARTDDMIVASGYNISGPEVEEALLAHRDVKECAVVGAPDLERSTNMVKAYVVLSDPAAANGAKAKELQDFVKATIAPYKAPREIAFVDSLPRTETGKLQRFKLRELERERAGNT